MCNRLRTHTESIEMTKLSYLWKPAVAASVAVLVMTAFEATKTLTLTHVTLWGSHAITILFVAMLVFGLSAIFQRRERARLDASIGLSDSLIESLPGVVCVFNSSGNIRRWNTNFLGHTSEEMRRAGIISIVAPESLESAQQTMKLAFDNGTSETEAWLTAKNGEKFLCYLLNRRILFENEPCVLEVAIDISARKRLEDHVRFLSAALEAAANSIAITDVCRAIQWVNPAFTRMTGYAREEAVGKNPRILKSGREGKSFYEDLWRTILAGNVWTGEITNRKKGGELYTEEMTIAPVRSATGEITNFVAVKQDVTERKRI